MKPFILTIILLGTIFAQTSAKPPKQTENPESEDDQSDSEFEDEEENESPALTCLLFRNLGCNTECSTIANAFSITGTGKCSEENVCECSLDQEASLENFWKSKFKALKDLKKIKSNEDLKQKVMDILEVPFQTAEQTKRQLKDVLPAELYKQLIINDKTPAAALVNEDNTLNEDKIKEYVTEQLEPLFKSSTKKLKSIDYKTALKDALKNNADDLQNIAQEIRHTKNKSLSRILDEYLKSSKTKEQPDTERDNLADAISSLIVDQFINQIESATKIPKRTSRTRSKKPSSSSQPVKKDRKMIPTPEPANEKVKKDAKKSAKQPSKKSRKELSDSSDSESRFELPGFDKNFLDDFTGSMDETFKTDEYKVRYERGINTAVNVYWEKGTDKVTLEMPPNSSVHQDWRLGDVTISLHREANTAMRQKWDFGDTKFTYEKEPNGSTAKRWENGKRDQQMLEKYQNLILDWCSKNEFLVPQSKCAIF